MSNQKLVVEQQNKQVSVASDSVAIMQVIERAATNPEVDIVKLEKLLDMHERIQGKNAEVAFNSAMAEMQSEIPSIAERGQGHNIKYATLEDIIDVVRPIMNKYGFAVSFEVDNKSNFMTVTGVLMHRAGHSMRTSMTLPFDNSGSKNAVQAIGSSVSYGKRYVICAMLNIATRKEDDNGYAAVPVAKVTAIQAQSIYSLLEQCPPALKEGFLSIEGQPEDIDKSRYSEVLSKLKMEMQSWK